MLELILHTFKMRKLSIFQWEVSIRHLRRVWHADSGRSLLRITGPILFGNWILCSTGSDQPFTKTCRIFARLCTPNIPRHFSRFFSLPNEEMTGNVTLCRIRFSLFSWHFLLRSADYVGRCFLLLLRFLTLVGNLSVFVLSFLIIFFLLLSFSSLSVIHNFVNFQPIFFKLSAYD